MRKAITRDIIALSAVAMIFAGVRLEFGIGYALIVTGVLLFAVVLTSNRGGVRSDLR